MTWHSISSRAYRSPTPPRRVAELAEWGIEPVKRERYGNGMTKVIYRDADGNEISFGGPG